MLRGSTVLFTTKNAIRINRAERSSTAQIMLKVISYLICLISSRLAKRTSVIPF